MTVVDDIRCELGTSTENPFFFNYDNPSTTSFCLISNTSASNENLLITLSAFLLMVSASLTVPALMIAGSLMNFASGIMIVSLMI